MIFQKRCPPLLSRFHGDPAYHNQLVQISHVRVYIFHCCQNCSILFERRRTEATWIFTRVVNGKMGESVNAKLQVVRGATGRLVASLVFPYTCVPYAISYIYICMYIIFFFAKERKGTNSLTRREKPVR